MNSSGYFIPRTSLELAEAMTNGEANQMKLVRNIVEMCLKGMPYTNR